MTVDSEPFLGLKARWVGQESLKAGEWVGKLCECLEKEGEGMGSTGH